MVFVVQKYGVCGAKVWCLWCESMVFVVRKYGVSWVYVCILQFVRSVVADRQQHYRNPSAALSQSVSSCRGPIYRARIYVNTYEMEGGKCVFGNWNMHFWLCKDTGTMNLPLRLAECS